MAKIKLNKTYSSFNNDKRINRANEVRRDNDTIKTPTCTIYDVDYAVMSYIREVIHPQVEQDGQLVDVPIVYANGEKWAQVQKRGYMRDVKGKMLKIGEKVCIQEDIPSVNGMLYKNTICKVESFDSKKVQVQDRSGKLWWVAYNQVSASFL